MIKLDENLLVELGLGSLPKEEKTAFLRHMYETLEMRVGTRLAERMSQEQMTEFEQFITTNDEQGAFQWLERNFPNYRDVVAEEFEKLKGEIRPLAGQIASASQAQAAAGGQPGFMAPQVQPGPGQPSPYGQPAPGSQFANEPANPMSQPPLSPAPAPVQPDPFAQPQYTPAQPYGQPAALSQPFNLQAQPQGQSDDPSGVPSPYPLPPSQPAGGNSFGAQPQPQRPPYQPPMPPQPPQQDQFAYGQPSPSAGFGQPQPQPQPAPGQSSQPDAGQYQPMHQPQPSYGQWGGQQASGNDQAAWNPQPSQPAQNDHGNPNGQNDSNFGSPTHHQQ